MRDSYEALIIGGGAAGLSAALVLGRSCRSTLVIDDGRPRNGVAKRMHGMISRDGTPPLDLLATAHSELQRYPCVTRLSAHVDAISGEAGAFSVQTSDGKTYEAGRIVLATGVYDALPDIEGLREAWGQTAFVCPYCDGWEMRGKRLAVIGKGTKAAELAQELYQWSHDLVVCTESDDALSPDARAWLDAVHLTYTSERVARIHQRDGVIDAIEFADGSREQCDGVFLSAPLRARHPLTDQIGARVRSDGEIEIDERGRTSVAGVYAAGDAVTTVHQVVLAAASGVCAAMALNEDRIKEQVRQLLGRV